MSESRVASADHDISDNSSDDDNNGTGHLGRPMCKYGGKCYRKNPDHLKRFSHPQADEPVQKCSKPSSPLSDSVQLAVSSQIFLTSVHGIDDVYNYYAVSLKDILSADMGQLLESAQFNYMVDISWLMKQYPPEFRSCPLLVVTGDSGPALADLRAEASEFDSVSVCSARLDIPYGTHHTKMMLLAYTDGLRVVIHTANLIESDWFQKTQSLWISPLFPELQDDCLDSAGRHGESVTHFKSDLLAYLSAYRSPKLTAWIRRIAKHDLSSARVILIGSVPGRHAGAAMNSWGHLKLGSVLAKHARLPSQSRDSDWPITAQFSSIGSLGSTAQSWLCGEWLESLRSTAEGSNKKAQLSGSDRGLRLVYPSVSDVRESLEGYRGGGCLPYHSATARKQPWLSSFLHRWKADGIGRTLACPHVKTYARISPDGTKLAWLLLTSANLSKAAWGALEKQGTQLMIRSYELGVLILPSFSLQKHADGFGISSSPWSSNDKEACLWLPYDLPLTPYAERDSPWVCDIGYNIPDAHGCSYAVH